MEKYNNKIGRFYETPIGHLASVTTMLSNTKDMSGLNDWRDNIGHKEADLIVKRSGITGTNFHHLCEAKTTGINYTKYVDPIAKKLFRQLEPVIEANDLNISHNEVSLWSSVLELAGTTDAIGYCRQKLSVIDFKSCGYVPSSSNDPFIQDYWIQLICYYQMIKERLDMNCEQLVLFFSAKKQHKAGCYILDKSEFPRIAKLAIDRIKQFRELL